MRDDQLKGVLPIYQSGNPRSYFDFRFSGCGLNEDLTEGGGKMHEVIEQYAADNQLFINEFSAVFHKMLENGYQVGSSNILNSLTKMTLF